MVSGWRVHLTSLCSHRVETGAESMLAEAEGHALATAVAGGTLGRALAVRGDPDRSRQLVRASIEKHREAGLLVTAAAGCMSTWFVEMARDLEAAERALRQ